MRLFNPDAQLLAVRDPDRCFTGDAPTLAEIDAAYARENGSAASWVCGQLYDLSEFCGCRDKLTGRAMEQCSVQVSATYPWLKSSELMLFFWQMKSGKYGVFYGSVDPQKILHALGTGFMKFRSDVLDRIDRERRDAERAAWARESVSREEYCRLTGASPENPISELIRQSERKDRK